MIEPQLQAIGQDVNLKEGREQGANIRFQDVDSFIGRMDIRLAHHNEFDYHGKTKIFTVWFRPNLWYQFNGNPKAAFS